MHAPLHPDESSRLEALRLYFDEDVARDEGLQELARYVAEVCETPVSLVSVVEAKRQRFAASIGLDQDETSRDVSFCAHAILGEGVFEVPDAREDPRFRDNDLVTGTPNIRFYAGVPVATAEGLPIGALCVIDTTPRRLNPFQRRTLELFGRQVESHLDLRRKLRELERANAIAEEATLAKSLFVANMSHELRTPLTTIFGYTEILQEEANERGLADLAADIETIRAAGGHLLAVINEVLDLSKIEAGKMALDVAEFDVRSLVEGVAAAMRPTIENRGNVGRVEVVGELGEMFGDEIKLRQCLYNLLANAAKFTSDGTITLAATREARPVGLRASEDWLVFAVSDTGIGMTEGQAENIFQAFVQAESSTSRRFGGTGLGLALTRQFALLMGGNVAVRSAPGSGSVFTLEVPAVAPINPESR